MFSTFSFFRILLFGLPSFIPSGLVSDSTACKLIASALSSSSAVHFPGTHEYNNSAHRWVVNAQQDAACSVEPASADDVSKILQILGRTKTAFGIKGGGHFADEGVSSTKGVQIHLKRLNTLTYHENSQVVELGAGHVWDDVYAVLDKYGVNVLGGRMSRVGVSGFLLGGGYSWLSNRHGLAMDSILEYELVLPSGEIVTASEHSYPDLFFGLKGGFNNFGVVTKFTMPTYPQGQIWGGVAMYAEEAFDDLIDAVVDFQANSKDQDAMLQLGFMGTGGSASALVLYFYNAPEVKNGAFDKFLAIQPFLQDIKTRSFLDHILSISSPEFLNHARLRGHQNTIRIADVTKGMAQEVANQAKRLVDFAPSSLAACVIEPFIKSSVVRLDKSMSAWPHDHTLNPMSCIFFWDGEENDPVALEALFSAGNAIEEACAADGQDLSNVMLYPNYSAINATVESVYGSNLPRLKKLAAQYDPKGVMKRTGGFKF